MTLTPSDVGARAEAAVAAALVRSGKSVLLPLHGAHWRYDLAFEDEAGFHRVQCKAARTKGDVLFFRACSNTNNVEVGYEGQVDYFGVYDERTGEVYLVPVGDVPYRATLRLRPTRNGQSKGVRWARDYRLH